MRHAQVVYDLDRDLRSIFERRLQSMVVYGAASSDAAPIRTLAIVSGLSAADLDRCALRMEAWAGAGLATPLLLEADDFADALDAFPFEFGAILADHDVVSGANPFDGLRVDVADLRRACEVQARSHLLHLREGVIECRGDAGRLAGLVTASAPALRALLANVARLPQAPAPDAALGRVSELAAGGTISTDEARRLLPGYLDALAAFVRALDRWSEA